MQTSAVAVVVQVEHETVLAGIAIRPPNAAVARP